MSRAWAQSTPVCHVCTHTLKQTHPVPGIPIDKEEEAALKKAREALKGKKK